MAVAELCQAGKGLSLGLCPALCRALHLSVLSSRCWARAGGAACPGASSACLSPAVSSCPSLCPPSSQLSPWVSAEGAGQWGCAYGGCLGPEAAALGPAVTPCPPAGVGVPLVLTYVYGTVVLSLCRSRWGCRGSRTPADLGGVELDNLAKRESHPLPGPGVLSLLQRGAARGNSVLPLPAVNELWSVLPSPRAGEEGAPDAAASLPSSSRSPRPAWPGGDSQSASTVALAGSMLSEGQDTPDRWAGGLC